MFVYDLTYFQATKNKFDTYHLVCPIKYRRNVLSKEVEISLVEVCKNISERSVIHLIQIGADENHFHFLTQSLPKVSVAIIIRIVKSIPAKEIFRLHSEVKSKLCGCNYWKIDIISIQLVNIGRRM